MTLLYLLSTLVSCSCWLWRSSAYNQFYHRHSKYLFPFIRRATQVVLVPAIETAFCSLLSIRLVLPICSFCLMFILLYLFSRWKIPCQSLLLNLLVFSSLILSTIYCKTDSRLMTSCFQHLISICLTCLVLLLFDAKHTCCIYTSQLWVVSTNSVIRDFLILFQVQVFQGMHVGPKMPYGFLHRVLYYTYYKPPNSFWWLCFTRSDN